LDEEFESFIELKCCLFYGTRAADYQRHPR